MSDFKNAVIEAALAENSRLRETLRISELNVRAYKDAYFTADGRYKEAYEKGFRDGRQSNG